MYKFLVSNLLLLAIITTTLSYDFEDSFYNRVLATDLDETRDSLDSFEHPRARRDEEAVGNFDKCRRRRFKECCDTEFMENQYNQEREYKRECFKEIYGKDKDAELSTPDPFKCDKVNKHRKDMTCFVRCIAQKRSLIDTDGNLIESQFSAHAKKNFKESWLISYLENIITKCLAEARNATVSQNKGDTNTCNPASIKGFHCLYREIQLKCPEELIKDVKTCSKFKEKVKKHQELRPTQQELESD